MGAQSAKGSPDERIAALAARQHGVVSREQLEAAGIHRRGRTRRVQGGRLHRIHRGVYAVGHRGLSQHGRLMAAVLAFGSDAVISHQSAGALWGLLCQPDVVHLTLPGKGGHRARPGIRVHHSLSLDRGQTTVRWNIPVTNPSRTLTDLRGVLPKPQSAAALRQAEFLGLPLEGAPEADHTHSGRSAFESDRARDVELRLLGHEVVRFTWRQLTDRPREVAAALRKLLALLPRD